MIVKNEEHVIRRCLETIYRYIDYYVICDTGSTDNTITVIKDFFKETKIDGEIHQHDWVDFGHNRTKALELCYGKTNWALMIDADDYVEGFFDISNLENSIDGISFNIESHDFTYPRIQMFNLVNKKWKYIEPIHEYPTCEGYAKIKKIDGEYSWISGRDGNRNTSHKDIREKYFKDYLLLEKSLIKNPHNARNQFYAAQSAFDAGLYYLAEKEYIKRIDMGGWKDEVFYSWYRIAACREHMGMPAKDIINACTHAIETDHERAEPYVQASRILRMLEMPRSAHVFASSGKASRMSRDKLFVHKDCYLWRIYDEVGATAYYAGKIKEGRSACEKLLKDGHLPEVHRARVESNLRFYS